VGENGEQCSERAETGSEQNEEWQIFLWVDGHLVKRWTKNNNRFKNLPTMAHA